MPKMIDGEKVIKWLHEVVLSELPAKTEGYDRGKEHMVQMLTSLINSGTFDLTPPVQPDTEIDPYNLPISTTIKGRMTRTEYENIYGKPREVINNEQR